MERNRFLQFWDNKAHIFMKKHGSSVMMQMVQQNSGHFGKNEKRGINFKVFLFFREISTEKDCTIKIVVPPEQPVFPCKRKALPSFLETFLWSKLYHLDLQLEFSVFVDKIMVNGPEIGSFTLLRASWVISTTWREIQRFVWKFKTMKSVHDMQFWDFYLTKQNIPY